MFEFGGIAKAKLEGAAASPPRELSTFARLNPTAATAWILGSLLVLFFAQLDVAFALAHGDWRSSPETMIGRDFVNVFTAGKMMFDGGLSSIYDVAAYRGFQDELFHGFAVGHNYSYAPVSFFYVWLFALVPYGLAFVLWIGLTGAAFAWAARPYLRDAGLPAWLAVVTPAAAMNVWAGHYGFFFGALWLGAWSMLDSRPRLAGVLVGLMIVKPHLAILMPLLLAARGAWRTFFYAGLTVVALVAASGMAFGWQLWAAYVGETLFFQASLIDRTGDFFLKMMSTAYPSFRLAGFAPAAAWLLQACCALAAIAAMLRWMPRDPRVAGLAGAAATFLVLPYAFNYDMTVVGVAAVILLHTAREDAAGERIAAALALVLPAAVIVTNLAGLPVAPLILLVLLGALLSRRTLGRDEETAPAPFREERQPA